MKDVPDWYVIMIGVGLAMLILLGVLGIRGWFPWEDKKARPSWVPQELKRSRRKHHRSRP